MVSGLVRKLVLLVHSELRKEIHGFRFCGAGWYGQRDLEPALGGLHCRAAFVMEVPAAFVRSDIVSALMWIRHRFIRLILSMIKNMDQQCCASF